MPRINDLIRKVVKDVKILRTPKITKGEKNAGGLEKKNEIK